MDTAASEQVHRLADTTYRVSMSPGDNHMDMLLLVLIC